MWIEANIFYFDGILQFVFIFAAKASMNGLLDSHQRNLRGGDGGTVYILYLYSKLF